jgi:hypothetical protein
MAAATVASNAYRGPAVRCRLLINVIPQRNAFSEQFQPRKKKPNAALCRIDDAHATISCFAARRTIAQSYRAFRSSH